MRGMLLRRTGIPEVKTNITGCEMVLNVRCWVLSVKLRAVVYRFENTN